MKNSDTLVFVADRTYGVVSICLLLVYGVIFYLFVPGWTDEYWDHTAAIRALVDNLNAPRHPFFEGPYWGDRWFNPYLLTLAAISKISGIAPLVIVKFGAMFNLVLLCTGIYLFTSYYLDRGRAATWVLLSYIFFWTTRGAMVRELAYYPSFFVASGSFLLWYLFVRYIREGKLIFLICTATIGGVFWLSHQLQGGVIFANGFLLAILERSSPGIRRWGSAVVIPTFAIACGELWPYFSSLKLLWDNFSQFGYKEPGRNMLGEIIFYGYVLGPNVLAAAFVMLKNASTTSERFLKLSIASSVILWVPFFLVRSQYAGILIGNAGNMAALGVGLFLANRGEAMSGTFLARASWIPKPRHLWNLLLLILCLSMLLQVKYTMGWMRQYYWLGEGARYRAMIAQYSQLAQYIGPDETVLSDVWTSWQLPSFAGKVLTRPEGHHLDYNVPRPEIRRRAQDLETFFAPESSRDICQAIIDRYRVKYLLINRVQTPTRTPSAYAQWGREIFSSDIFVLILITRMPDALLRHSHA